MQLDINSGFGDAVRNNDMFSVHYRELRAAPARYAVARGLCGYTGPHQQQPGNPRTTSIATAVHQRARPSATGPAPAVVNTTPLVYSLPHSRYSRTFPFDEQRMALARAASPEETARGDELFGEHEELRDDFVALESYRRITHPRPWPEDDTEPQFEYEEDSREVKWLPASVEAVSVNGTEQAQASLRDADPVWLAICNASIIEHLIDHYAKLAVSNDPATNTPEMRLSSVASRAAAKLQQLESMAAIATASQANRIEQFAHKQLARAGNPIPAEAVFFTRGCLRCPGGDLMYPVDAGLACFTLEPGALNTWRAAERDHFSPIWGHLRTSQEVLQAVNSEEAVMTRGTAPTRRRADLTRGMRGALGPVERGGDAVPLFVSAPPEITMYSSGGQPHVNRMFTHRFGNAREVSIPNIRAALRDGLDACKRLSDIECEMDYVTAKLSEQADGTPSDAADQAARIRRDAIYNDALREAAISGDPLWTFVQQLSGTIAEPVEEICVLDETEMMKQNRERQDRQRQASQRAADAHFAIVRNVFQAVLRDSGVKIGVTEDGSGFKILNTTLKKQAAELAQRPPTDSGFFANSVNLEHLLADGRGELTLETLFTQLNRVGVALQHAAETYIDQSSSTAITSLEFLRAPRNSLFIQWKDQIKAGIRRAYDYFTNEMRQHGHMARAISAYELIEGADPELCNSFAEFTAQYIAMTRMHNPSSAMYVSQNAAAVGSHKTRIALQRLVATACRYMGRYQSPSSAGSREAYFRGGGAGFAMVMQQRFVNRGGWQQLVPRMGPM